MFEQLFLAFGVFVSIAVFFAFNWLSKLADKERDKALGNADATEPAPQEPAHSEEPAEPEPEPLPEAPKTSAEEALEAELAKLLGK